MSFENTEEISSTINDLSQSIYEHNFEVGWWDDLDEERFKIDNILDNSNLPEAHKSEVLNNINKSINLIKNSKTSFNSL